jgi:hypothetical protein
LADLRNLGDRHSVFHQGAKARRLLCRDLGYRRRLRGRRRIDRFLANRRRRQDGQYAGFVRLDRLRRIGNRLHVEFRFRREKRLGGVACAHHLFAIIAAKLALLLMAVGQELLGQVGYSPI